MRDREVRDRMRNVKSTLSAKQSRWEHPGLLLLGVGVLASGCPVYVSIGTWEEVSGGSTGSGSSTSATSSTSGTTTTTSTGGPGVCVLGATQACYDGPTGTEGVGTCKAGTQTCDADGGSWGPCVGEVLPQPPDCVSGMDLACTGKVPSCAGAYTWADAFQGSLTQSGQAVAVDSSGSVVLTGYYVNDGLDFGPGPLTTGGGGFNVFVVKLDPSGGYVWGSGFGDGADQIGYGVAVDTSGNVFITGYAKGGINFGGGILESAGGKDVFVAKFNAAGEFVWAKLFGDSQDQAGQAIAVDSAGDVYVTGYVNGSIDFGGGALTSAGGADAFAVKLSGSNGNYVWAKLFGDSQDQAGQGIAVDSSGHVHVTGYVNGSVDFGGGTLTSAGGADAFAVKLSGSDGSYVWAKLFGDSQDQAGQGIAVAGSGDVYVTGYVNGSVDFGGGVLTSAGSADVFTVKLSGNDGSYVGKALRGFK